VLNVKFRLKWTAAGFYASYSLS